LVEPVPEPEDPDLLGVLGKIIGEVSNPGPKPQASKASLEAWNICKHYIATPNGRISQSKIPLLQTLLPLLFNGEDPLWKGNELKGTKIEVGTEEFCELGRTFIRVICDEGEYGDLEPVDRVKETLAMLGLKTAKDWEIIFDQRVSRERAQSVPFPVDYWRSRQCCPLVSNP
jgi:hypothetical protein